MARVKKWLSDNASVILAVLFCSYIIVSLWVGSPDPRMWSLKLIPSGQPGSSSLITKSNGRVVTPGSSGSSPSGPSGSEAPSFGVYSDQDCTTSLSEIHWGTLYPGDSKTILAYVRNTGSSSFTMDLSTAQWSSAEAEQYLALAWNYDGETVEPGQVVPVKLTLQVSPSTTGVTDFSFDIVVTASTSS